MGMIYEIRHSDGLRRRGVHTKFRKDCFRHSKVNMREFIDTQTALRSYKPTLLEIVETLSNILNEGTHFIHTEERLE
jgi:hypothetical protein